MRCYAYNGSGFDATKVDIVVEQPASVVGTDNNESAEQKADSPTKVDKKKSSSKTDSKKSTSSRSSKKKTSSDTETKK